MFSPSYPAGERFQWALAVSALIHALILLLPRHEPESKAPPPLQARLAPLPPKPVEAAKPPVVPKALPPVTQPRLAKSRIMTTNKPSPVAVPSEPKWSAAEKADMNRFLDELSTEAKSRPQPTLAQRAMAMARDEARQMAQQEQSDAAVLELRPNAAPPDPFSLEMYVEALVRRLNRSASFVKNDPRSKGVHTASVQFRLNPDGSLKSFTVLNAGDQAEEIAFIKSVVERAVPFAPFPADVDKAARSLALTICIMPARGGEGGFGFSRGGNSRHC